jgi:transposase-like protein/transposase
MEKLESQADSVVQDYLNPDIPVVNICTKYGVSQDTFYRWTKGKNLPGRETKTPAQDRIDAVADDVLERYMGQGISIVTLSREVGVAPVAMRSWMRGRGVELRGSYEAQMIRRKAEGRETTFADEEALRLYAGTQMPVLEIEKETGVPIHYLYKQIRESGIPLRSDSVEAKAKAKSKSKRKAKKKLSASAKLLLKHASVEKDVAAGMTISDLAWKYGVSEMTVARYLRRQNLGPRKGALTAKQKRIVGAWEETDLTMYRLAKHMGYSYSTVRDTLSKVGLRQPGTKVGRPPGRKMGQR